VFYLPPSLFVNFSVDTGCHISDVHSIRDRHFASIHLYGAVTKERRAKARRHKSAVKRAQPQKSAVKISVHNTRNANNPDNKLLSARQKSTGVSSHVRPHNCIPNSNKNFGFISSGLINAFSLMFSESKSASSYQRTLSRIQLLLQRTVFSSTSLYLGKILFIGPASI